MGNTVPPCASRAATGTGRRSAGTGGRRSENVVDTEVAPPGTPRRAGRPRAGRSLPAGGADGGAAPAAAGKVVVTVKIVMTRKDAEALVARLKAPRSARERKARMAVLEGELRAGSCGGARRPTMLPPIKESRFERVTPAV